MLTNEDVLKDRIKQLEGELQYRRNSENKVVELMEKNLRLQRIIERLEKQVKHLIKELEFE